MRTIKVQGKILRDENYLATSVREVEEGLEINTPSTLLNLISLEKRLRVGNVYGFEYKFPLSFDPRLSTNSFKSEFPIIFE